MITTLSVSENQMKVLMVNDFKDCGFSYYRPFAKYGECHSDVKILDTHPGSVKLVVFTGGSDVDPSFYGEKPSPMTSSNPYRDNFEIEVFNKSRKEKIPMIGICRGAQFLCVFSGGKLVQHINGHHGYHNCQLIDGRIIKVNSTHHQMMLPCSAPEATILAWASPTRSDIYLGENGIKHTPSVEYEAIWFPKTQSAGIQWHPETLEESSNGFKYCQEIVENLLLR